MNAARAYLVAALAALAVLLFAPRASAQLLSPGPLAKAHAQLEGDQHCNECHSSGKRVEQGLCLKCHGDIGQKLGAGQGLHGRQYKGKPCEQCHADHLGAGARLVRWDPQKFNHEEAGWTLNGAHKNTACAKCHSRTNSRGAPTFLGAPTACNACHKDVHENRFGATCTNCHTEASWKELNLKSFNHDTARFPLKGSHAKVQCAKCHQEPPKYVGLKFQQCSDCHKDPHAGKLGPTCNGCHDENAWKPANMGRGGHPGVSLANGHAQVACKTCHDKGNLAPPSKGVDCASCHRPVHKAPFGRGCAQCHASITWTGLSRSIGLAAHGRTAYPLTGKHEHTNCVGCHKPELPRETRYRALKFGKCLDCHEDKHKREFAQAQPTGAECATCHSTAGYRPTLFNATAHAATKFPLVGKHVSTACSACHETPRPRVDLRVAKKVCAECHANPHGDQFTKEMAQGGCAHCHEPGGWDLPKIDHTTWPLTGAHATARCESCHKPTPEDRKSGKGASYRGVPRNCAGCHDDQHAGQFKTGEPVIAECDKCHATNIFKIPKFDHATQARYPLTGAHGKLACDKCHAMTKLKDGTETIRWRLPQSACGYCHADPHARAAK